MANETTRIVNLPQASEVSDGLNFVVDSVSGTKRTSASSVASYILAKVTPDTTLAITGKPADAKATGDAIVLKSDISNIAPAFSTGIAYSIGDYVSYNGSIYKFTSAHSAGAWNSSHVASVVIVGEIDNVKSGLEDDFDALVEVGDTQPQDDANKIWIKETVSEVQVPTYEEFTNLNNNTTDYTLTTSISGSNTTKLFWSWYNQAQTGSVDRYTLLCRFFDAIAQGWYDKTYTLKYYVHTVSSSSEMTPMDDLVGKTAAPLCTEASSDEYHWTDEDPMYWYIRANALSKQDGAMNILAFEGESGFDITGETAPVYTFKMAKWYKEWTEGDYNFISWRTTYESGYRPYAADVGLDDEKRAITWLPTFPGGLTTSGKLTSGSNKAPYVFASASAGIGKARNMSAYEGLWSDQDTTAVLHDWWFRHFNLENSGVLEGCTNYYLDYSPAVAETNVERVIVTTSQGANFIVGSTVSLTDTARASSGAFVLKKILSKETVTINSTEYIAINIGNDGDKFSTTTSMHLCTMPWYSGSTEALPGHKDGSIVSLTTGKTPIRVGGVEMMHGAYDIGLDPLYNVTANATAGFDYAVYECKNSEKLATSITSDYVATGITLTGVTNALHYVKSFVRNIKGILLPDAIDNGADSSKYFKSAFLVASSSGVRCPCRFASLSSGGSAGLACESGLSSPPSSTWSSRPRLSGSGKKRGNWTA